MLPCLPQCCVITIECCWKNPYFSFMSAPPCLFAFPFTPHFVIGASLQKPVWPLTLLEGDDSGVEDQSQNSSISKKSWVISQDICTLKYLSHPYYISVGLKIDFPNTLKIPISFITCSNELIFDDFSSYFVLVKIHCFNDARTMTSYIIEGFAGTYWQNYYWVSAVWPHTKVRPSIVH